MILSVSPTSAPPKAEPSASPDREVSSSNDALALVGRRRDRLRQQWLLRYENPLKSRFGAEFFRAIPRRPGVYVMRGELNEVLYVGKAKDLRARLNSYRQAKPDAVSRKVIRLINVVRRIDWEECASEKDALILENRRLREWKPPFNTANKHPESYHFIGVGFEAGELTLRLTTNPEPEGDLLYGAYKGRGTLREGYAALLRLLWLTSRPAGRFEFPPRLTTWRAPPRFSVPFEADELPALKRYLRGRDRGFLQSLTRRLLERDEAEVPRFLYHVIETDLATCAEVFERCFRRNRELRRHHAHRPRLIAQEAVDDLLVLEGVRQGRIDDQPAESGLDPSAIPVAKNPA